MLVVPQKPKLWTNAWNGQTHVCSAWMDLSLNDILSVCGSDQPKYEAAINLSILHWRYLKCMRQSFSHSIRRLKIIKRVCRYMVVSTEPVMNWHTTGITGGSETYETFIPAMKLHNTVLISPRCRRRFPFCLLIVDTLPQVFLILFIGPWPVAAGAFYFVY